MVTFKKLFFLILYKFSTLLSLIFWGPNNQYIFVGKSYFEKDQQVRQSVSTNKDQYAKLGYG